MIEDQLENAGALKKLLFAQGEELEAAILEAMRLMGFVAIQVPRLRLGIRCCAGM